MSDSPFLAAFGATATLVMGVANLLGAIDVTIDASFIVAVGGALVGLVAAVHKMRSAGTRQATEIALLRLHVSALESALESAGINIPRLPKIQDVFPEDGN